MLTGKRICVKQGFTNCSVCTVGTHAIITSDSMIAGKSAKAGLDVLQITPGMIRLDGYDHGFIGGASLRIRDDLIAFTGHLDDHSDKDQILRFIHERGIQTVFLSEMPIFDIGGCITLP